MYLVEVVVVVVVVVVLLALGSHSQAVDYVHKVPRITMERGGSAPDEKGQARVVATDVPNPRNIHGMPRGSLEQISCHSLTHSLALSLSFVVPCKGIENRRRKNTSGCASSTTN